MANDNDIVELSISELIEALAEALKVVTTKRPAFQKGDRVSLSGRATISSIDHHNVHVRIPVAELHNLEVI